MRRNRNNSKRSKFITCIRHIDNLLKWEVLISFNLKALKSYVQKRHGVNDINPKTAHSVFQSCCSSLAFKLRMFLWKLFWIFYFVIDIFTYSNFKICLLLKFKTHFTITLFQKQPSRDVLKKRCSENMQQIYRGTPWMFYYKFAAYFQNTFS